MEPSLGLHPHGRCVSAKGQGGRRDYGVTMRYMTEFMSIAESVHHQHRRVRGVGFPIDILDKGFKHTQVENSFPFEEIGRDKVKIKSIPISFQWASKGTREV